MVDGKTILKFIVAGINLFFIVHSIVKMIAYGGHVAQGKEHIGKTTGSSAADGNTTQEEQDFEYGLVVWLYIELAVLNSIQLLGDIVSTSAMLAGGVKGFLVGYAAGSCAFDYFITLNIAIFEQEFDCDDKAQCEADGEKFDAWGAWTLCALKIVFICLLCIGACASCAAIAARSKICSCCVLVVYFIFSAMYSVITCWGTLLFLVTFKPNAMTVLYLLGLIINMVRLCLVAASHAEGVAQAVQVPGKVIGRLMDTQD